MKKLLITGSSGFIGFNLSKYLAGYGGYQMHGVDSCIFGGNQNTFLSSFIPNDFSDISNSLLKKIDTLVHLAAIKKHNSDINLGIIDVNAVSTYKLFENAAKSGVRKIIFASSLYAHGNMYSSNTSEYDKCSPDTMYGVTKLFGEQSLSVIAKEFDIKCIVARLYFVYGPFQYSGFGYPSVFLRSFDRLSNNLPPVIINDGNQKLDYIYISDVVDFFHSAIDTDIESNFKVVNICSSNLYSINEVVSTVCNKWNSKHKSIFNPIYNGHDFTKDSYRSGNNNLANESFAWRPKISLDKGVDLMMDWYLENRTVL